MPENPPEPSQLTTDQKLQELLMMSTSLRKGKIKFHEGKGRGVTLIQGNEKKVKPPPPGEPPSDLPPAPVDETIPPTEPTDLSPAPNENIPGSTPLPEKFAAAVGAVKAADGTEVIHEEGALAAKQIEQEERDMYKYKWEKKDLLLGIPALYKVTKRGLIRFHQNTIGQAAKFSKDRSQSVDMMAEAGLQYRSLPKEFRKELDEVVYGELMQRRFRRKVWWAGSNILHGLTWSTTELDDHRNEWLRKLRTAVIENIDMTENSALFESYKKVLSGDYNAREELMKRMAEDVGGNLIDDVAGEKKTVLKLTDQNDPLRKFLMIEIIKPLLREGISTTGITPKTRLQMMVKLDEYLTSKDFVDWWSKAKAKNAAGSEVSLSEIMEASLSFGNTIISAAEQQLLPQLKIAQEHQESQDRFDDYLDNLPMEISLGTVNRAQKEQMPITILEKLVSKGVDRKKVLEHYTALKDSGPSVVSGSGNLTAASINRAELVRNLGSRGRGKAFGAVLSEAYWVAPIVAGVGISRTVAAAWVNGMAPVIGAAATYGVWRATQEMSLFNSNVAMHRIEKTLNYSFSDNARLRKESEKFRLHQRGMVDYTNKINAAVSSGNYKELMGYLSDIEARRQIQNEKKVTLFQASSWKDTSLQEKENTAMRVAAVKARATIEDYFTKHPDVFTQLKTDLGFAGTVILDEMIGVDGGLTQDFKNNILTGVNIDRLTNLGNGFSLDKKEAIQKAEATVVRSKIWKGISIGTFSFGAAVTGAVVVRPLMNYALDQALIHNVPVISDVLKWANWVRKEVIPGPNVSHEILSKPVGPPVERILTVGQKTIKTLVPDGADWDPKWKAEVGKPDVWDLVAVKQDGTEVPLINDATFDAATGKMIGFDAAGSKISKNIIEQFQQEFGKTIGGKGPDVDWVNKLVAGKSLQYSGYNFLLDKANHLMITDVNGHEVAHNMINFDPVTKKLSYTAIQGNPIPEKLLNALRAAGLIANKDEAYQNIRLLDHEGLISKIGRVPQQILNQLYKENQVFDTSVQHLAPSTEGGTGGLLGEVPMGQGHVFDSNEAIWLGYQDWKPFPMTEIVDGHPVFSLAHFINAWEEVKVINDHQVEVIAGPNMGKIFEMNPVKGFENIGNRTNLVNDLISSGRPALFDSLNHVVGTAPKGMIDDIVAAKSGQGDLSNFFMMQRPDPLSTKGIVEQFSGTNQWNAFLDPRKLPGIVKDWLFTDDKGSVRGLTYFLWKEKGSDFSQAFAFANIAPTEDTRLTLVTPIIDTTSPIIPKLPFDDSISELIPTTNEVLRADVSGIPFIPVRRPLETHEQGVETQRQPTQPAQQPRPQQPPSQQPQRTKVPTRQERLINRIRLETSQNRAKRLQHELDKLKTKDVSKGSNEEKITHMKEVAKIAGELVREQREIVALEAKKREMEELENKLNLQKSKKDKDTEEMLKKGKIAMLERQIERTQKWIEREKNLLAEDEKKHPQNKDLHKRVLAEYEQQLFEYTESLEQLKQVENQ